MNYFKTLTTNKHQCTPRAKQRSIRIVRVNSCSLVVRIRITSTSSFTLTELLVVIAIIALLIGLAFPAYLGVQDQAKRMQAKNDLVQITAAVNAYLTEYGKYPLTPNPPSDTTYGIGITNDQLFNVLRGLSLVGNPRRIVFLSPPDAKDPIHPHSGMNGTGQYLDPWGVPYLVRVDTDYDNQVSNPYAQNAGSAPYLRSGVIAWSFGKDTLSQSTTVPPVDKNSGVNKDDIISWQ